MSVPPIQNRCVFNECVDDAVSTIGHHPVCAEHGEIALARLSRLLGIPERELVASAMSMDGHDG